MINIIKIGGKSMKMKKVKFIILSALLILFFLTPCFVYATNDIELEQDAEPRWFNPGGNWPGYIFATLDNATSSWNHGHAGIGGDNGETIEAYSNTNVAIFSNGYASNWSNCSTGGIYSVNGASSSQYTSAKSFAYSKVGTPYSTNLMDGDSTFYCSELVYRAWEQAGIKVGTNILGLITQKSIMNHSNTTLVYEF